MFSFPLAPPAASDDRCRLPSDDTLSLPPSAAQLDTRGNANGKFHCQGRRHRLRRFMNLELRRARGFLFFFFASNHGWDFFFLTVEARVCGENHSSWQSRSDDL